MEYIFGTIRYKGKLCANLKTICNEHTDLTDFVEIKREYTDSEIIDRFRVVEKYATDENGENCYDFYIIDNHYRYIDKTKIPNKQIEELQSMTALLEDALCEIDAANEERIAVIEDALCEMDKG
jgi:hypothetical protein